MTYQNMMLQIVNKGYDVANLVCDRCPGICNYGQRRDDGAVICTGSLEVCPLADEVEEKIEAYRHDSSMTMEFLIENTDPILDRLTETLNEGNAPAVMRLLLKARHEYFIQCAINEVAK